MAGLGHGTPCLTTDFANRALKIPEPHDFDDAAWVGYRLTEVMPVQLLAKQQLLELDDPVSRLEVLFAYLSQRKLLI